jgi:hypothetical protein
MILDNGNVSINKATGSTTLDISGSVLITGSLNVTQGITGSLLGTSSFADRALTASFALNGGVTQLLAGPNITLSPISGLGQVTVSSTGTGGPFFNTATGSYGSFYDTTIQTNPVANVPRSMSFDSTDITNGVSISGSTSPFNTYIKTENPGVYNIQFSAQVEKTDSGTDEIVIWLRKNGINLTDTATKLTLSGNATKVVAAWNWFASSAANDYYQIIWSSADTGMRLYAEPAGGTPGIPSVILTVNRVDQFLSNTGSFSGSFIGQFTGSLNGTSSWSTNSITASFAPLYVLNSVTSSMLSPYLLTSVTSSMLSPYMLISSSSLFVGTGSFNSFTSSINNRTSSFATTGSNLFIGNQTINGSLNVSASSFLKRLVVGDTSSYTGAITGSDYYQRSTGTGTVFIVRDISDNILFAAQGSAGSGIFYSTANTIGLGFSSPTAKVQIRGNGATSATTTLLVQNSTPSNLLTILDNGQQIINSPIMSLSASGSGYIISQSISHSAVIGAQIYGVNILPVFYSTTASQTETAFRVNATYTGSAAATLGTNIIADFGSTTAGSQLTVTDVTSGSIYMVNDVSGLPIIEATSDWGVKIYDFPRVVLEKTGSNIIITGSLLVTGSLVMSPTSSFVFPLTASSSPQTGSAYWSGSFLFVWNGSRYMSSSFS